MRKVTLAGGCFWCLEAVYTRIKGVSSVVSGYTGGSGNMPTYEQVSSGSTGHAEAVQVTFDESTVSPDVIIDLFFTIHDPTTLNRQGNDVGTQYRSAMFYATDDERQEFTAGIERAQTLWSDVIVTEIAPLDTFYPAEDYHQSYYENNTSNPYCAIVIDPKISKARKAFKEYFL